ncbi:MAG: nonstructural protein [Microvirus sp.]|nr:MAG: nonstructural protein [Microvirus sp.]
MILNAYSVYDNKALQYHAPFFTSTDGAAVRMLSDLANDTNTNVGRHPSDYVLYCVGTYSDANGSLEPTIPLRHIMDAVALITLKPTGSLFADLSEATAENISKLRKATK